MDTSGGKRNHRTLRISATRNFYTVEKSGALKTYLIPNLEARGEEENSGEAGMLKS